MSIYNHLLAHATKLLGEPTSMFMHYSVHEHSWQTSNGELKITRWNYDIHRCTVSVQNALGKYSRLDLDGTKGLDAYVQSAKRKITDFASRESRESVEAKILRALGLTELALAAGFDLDDIAIYGGIGLFGEQIVRIERCREGGGDPPVGSPDDNIFFYAGDGKTPSKVSLKIEHGDCITLMSGPADQLVSALTQGVRQ